jgi:hypothetical protein
MSLPRALTRGRMRGAVATNKEQLLARLRDGERAGTRRRCLPAGRQGRFSAALLAFHLLIGDA